MLPTAVKRVQFYSRNSHEKYVYWLIETVKIPYHESLFKTNSRNVVDGLVVKMISEGKTITETTVLAPIIREIEDTTEDTILEPVMEKIEEQIEPSWVKSAKKILLKLWKMLSKMQWALLLTSLFKILKKTLK